MAVKQVDQMAMKQTKIFHCKTLQNLPKLVFSVCHLAALSQRETRGKTQWDEKRQNAKKSEVGVGERKICR
jgi:hypothetical protein